MFNKLDMFGASFLSILTLAGPYAQFVSLRFRSPPILWLATLVSVLFELWFIAYFSLPGQPLITVIAKGGAAFFVMRLPKLGYFSKLTERAELRNSPMLYFREVFTLRRPGDASLVSKPFPHHFQVAFSQYLLANLIFVYFRTHPPRTKLETNQLLDFTDFELTLQTGLYCVLLYSYMSFMYLILFGSVSYLVGTTYYSIHDSPFTSLSLREFWNQRWNRVFQSDFRAIIAQPVYNLATKHLSLPRRPAMFLAGWTTFAFSGVFHEYLVGYLLEQPVVWENFRFFMIQGAAVSGEILLGYMVPRWKPPSALRIAINLVFFLWTSPLFINPYMRASVHITCVVPLLF
ncbi:hypothetical protein K493DRAFT_300646 [Basidiobolus meristosporus CBS 931.73]|uniref:Wax synthase domain-containing protein n=1 Tax=Basidiobolus meristosporus CBS 931.73 TaxID=1314790 RepID=A0A1Y1YG45_9FUNG|nr:hypothetical protein K493DRAFT_300646 [Basidiobolus meristosporus CBS 931.73]|eukprot:ORX96991.1 hypothetical protein K493DRAFT_300646 [Basidiobolus meristosporus CBS 931.73]